MVYWLCIIIQKLEEYEMKKRFLFTLLCLVMTVAMLSGTAAADDPGYTFDAATGTLTINNNAGATAWVGTVDPNTVVTLTVASSVSLDNAFNESTSLKSVAFRGGSTVTNSFSNCPNLETIDFGGPLTAESAFNNLPKLKTLFIRQNSVVDNAFTNLNSLGTLTFEGIVTSLPDNAYFNLPALKSVTFMNSASLTHNAFRNCFALESITIQGSAIITGVNFIPGVYGEKPEGSIFYDNPTLKTLTIGGSATLNDVFDSCGFTTITIGGKSDIVGCFNGCNVTTLTFNDDAYVHTSFNNCKALQTVTFNGNVDGMKTVFNNCDSLHTVTFNGNGDGNLAFNSNPSLKTVTVAGPSVFVEAFDNNTNLQSVILSGKTTIWDAFRRCPASAVIYISCDAYAASTITQGSSDVPYVQVNHALAGVYDYDDTQHWKLCTNDGCPENGILEKEDHSGNPCVCGYVRPDEPTETQPVAAPTETTEVATPTETQEVTPTEPMPVEGRNTLLVLVILLVLVVCAAVAGILLLYIKRPRR